MLLKMFDEHMKRIEKSGVTQEMVQNNKIFILKITNLIYFCLVSFSLL
jgi:hypothetical protein